MKTSKLMYILGAVLIVMSMTLFSGYVSADNDKNNEDHGNSEQAKEAHKRGSTLEVHISNKGKVTVEGAKVTAVTDSNVTATTTWGVAVLSWSVNVSPTTKIVRKYGGTSLTSEVSIGDIISFQGDLVTTSATPIVVNATQLKNWSVQKKGASFNGVVKSVDTAGSKFVLTSNKDGEITVVTNSTTKFEKGPVAGVFADITVGAKVLAKGVYDLQLKQLTAEGVKVYLPEVKSTNMSGKIKSLPGATAPTTMVVTSDDKDFTVNIATDTSFLNASWLKIALTSFKVGDKIKVYGVINTNMAIDATVVQDTSI